MTLKTDTEGVADVTYSCYNAMERAGGNLRLAQEILTNLGAEHVENMGRNGIRFTYDKKTTYHERSKNKEKT